MSVRDKERIIELNKAIKIAKTALEKIKHGSSNVEDIAEDALCEMFPLEAKQPLQGLVGHDKRKLWR